LELRSDFVKNQSVYKPGSVRKMSNLASAKFDTYLCSHSSGRNVTTSLMQPTRTIARRTWACSRLAAYCSYSVLLPVGFTMPLPLLAMR